MIEILFLICLFGLAGLFAWILVAIMTEPHKYSRSAKKRHRDSTKIDKDSLEAMMEEIRENRRRIDEYKSHEQVPAPREQTPKQLHKKSRREMNCTSCGKELSEFEEKEYGLWGSCKNCFDKDTEKVMKERKCYEDEYEKFVHQLVQQFKGKCLEEAIPGKIVSNEHGDCYLIADECISEFRKDDYDNLAGFCKNDNLAIIDIETLGLSFENTIILLGIANIRKNKVCTHQFLLRDVSEELGAIWSFLSHVENGSTLITYNGKSFDIPYINQRLSYYGKEASLNNHHYDILHFARRALGKKLPNCCLETVEKYFGIQREKDIDGFQVPQLYNTYLKTRNVGPLVPIVEHNKQDLINLGIVVSRLHEIRNFRS